MIEFLDSWSTIWLEWLAARSLAFAVAFLVVTVPALLLARRKWLSAHGVSLAILLPTVLLVLPCERWLPGQWPSVLPASVSQISSWSQAEDTDEPAITEREAVEPAAPQTPDPHVVPTGASSITDGSELHDADDRFSEAPPPSARSRAAWIGLLAFGLWSLGCILAGTRLVLAQRRAERFLIETSDPADAHLSRMFESCCRRSKLRRTVRLRLSDELGSPATTGVLRPVIYLPTDAVHSLPEQQLRFVLLHELAHVRRADVWVEALLRCLRTAFFFHPLVWATVPIARRWRELACDEAALARAGSTTRTPSAEALLALADPARIKGRNTLAVAHLLNDGETMKTRIERLLDLGRAPRLGVDLRALATTTILGGLALTAARAQQVVREQPEEEATETEVVFLDDVTPSHQTEIEEAIQEGVVWLLSRQDSDGRFGLGVVARGKPRDHNDAFATGLVIQALLGERNGAQAKAIDRAIDRAVAWLLTTQDERGKIGGDDSLTKAYGHAQALRSLCMVQRVKPSAELKTAIENAIAYAEYHRNPYAGWRYEPKAGDNDSKITGLMMLALLEAQSIGIEVPRPALDGGRMVLESLTDESTGRTGFVERGSVMSRFVWKNDGYPREFTEEPTALNLIVAFRSGKDLLEERWMRRSVSLLVDAPPLWSPARGSIDYSYWQYGAEAMRFVDGYQQRLWRERLSTELAARRTKSGDGAYWAAIDAWSDVGMENWTTAAALVALQAAR
ncbi:MAG: M56 family metallopeptidase [Planctomycetota bacterium]